MAITDIIILVASALAAAWGFYKGIISQAGAIAAIVVGVIACRTLGAPAIEIVFPDIDNQASSLNYYGARMVVYAVIYFVAYYAVVLVAKMLKLAVHSVFLGPIDRMAGALFGVLKILIVLSFLFNAFEFFKPGAIMAQPGHVADGGLVELVLAIAPAMVGALSN